MNLIVSDASPLIVIAKSGLISVLNDMVEEVVIPEAVYAECTRNPRLSGADAVRAAVEAGRIHVRPEAAGSDGGPNVEGAGLDTGELAAIRLALELHCPVLMDERLGRQAARRQGLTVIGSAGLLIVAKQRGLIQAVAPILERWAQSGYFLSAALVRAVLERAGEA